MTYIEQERRSLTPENAEELAFAITRVLIDYTNLRGLDYQTINDVSGVCVEALAEYRRRVVTAFMPMQIAANGDVYPETFPTPQPALPVPAGDPPAPAPEEWTDAKEGIAKPQKEDD